MGGDAAADDTHLDEVPADLEEEDVLDASDGDADEADAFISEPEVLESPASDDEVQPDGVIVDLAADTAAAVRMPAIPALRARGAGTAVLDRFLSEIGRYPVLTRDEEDALALRYYKERDPIAARKLVVHNLRLVVKMAYKYRRTWVNVLDLIQEGNVGLVEAVRRFDPFKGARFSTYATFWIRAYMLRYMLEHSRNVRIARTRVGRKLFFRLSRERQRLLALGIEPGPKLLAERLGVDERALEEVAHHMDQPEISLDAPRFDDESGRTALDEIPVIGASPEAEAYRAEFAREVGAALDDFACGLTDERERAAWAEHLMSDDPVPLSELGARFGVTKQRMGQIVNALRKRLKDHLERTMGSDVELGFSLDEQ